MQKKGVSMPTLWPLLLLVTTQLISPAFAQVYGRTSSTVQHYDYDPVSEVATSASSSAFASSLPTTSHSATREDDSRLPVGYLVPSDTIHIVKVVTGPSATPAYQSQTSSTPAANLVRPVAGSDHGASHQARTYDEKPPFWINNEPHDKPAEVLIDIEDNPSDSFPADDHIDGTQSGKTSHNEDPVTPPEAGGLRCQPQAQRIASFSSSSLWGYSVDCGINRMPLEGESDDHSYCSEAEIQHAQDMADMAALEKAWEISSVQDCQRRAGERRKEKVERREKKQRRGMFLRNAWFRFNKQYEFDFSYTHSLFYRC
ncbi:hypothetical protein QFC21_000850 [Naganishia friedmannii]|uniref:Uncharacterized protein n=1 Tax=Naganishia friedmannii TaxID=89922 RepID=A0ACC2W8I5_9TREE|nr:hypothetical protein QFC21_000850 [Naganishia friedmannii]